MEPIEITTHTYPCESKGIYYLNPALGDPPMIAARAGSPSAGAYILPQANKGK